MHDREEEMDYLPREEDANRLRRGLDDDLDDDLPTSPRRRFEEDPDRRRRAGEQEDQP